MEAGAAERAARGQRRERVTDWSLMGQRRGKDILRRVYEYFLGSCLRRGQGPRRVLHTSVRQQAACGDAGAHEQSSVRRVLRLRCIVVQAERFVEVHGGQRRVAAHIELESSHPSQQLRILRRAGLGPQQQKPGLPSPICSATRSSWTSLTVARSRLHEVINAPEHG